MTKVVKPQDANPINQHSVHDASQSGQLETTSQTLEEVDMNDYATPSLVSLPPEVQSTIVSFVSVNCTDDLHTGDFIANED